MHGRIFLTPFFCSKIIGPCVGWSGIQCKYAFQMERNSNSGAAQPEPRQGPQLGTRGPGSTPSDPDPFGDNDVDTERARICQYSSASTGKNIPFWHFWIRYYKTIFSRCKCPILHPLGTPSLEMRLLSAEDPQPIQVQAIKIHQVSITDMILQFMNTHVLTLTYLWLVRSNVVTCPIFVCSIYKSQSILD